MNSPPLSEMSQKLLAAEGARDDGGEIADPDALLCRIRETVLARSKSRSGGIVHLARRPMVWLAAALVLGAGAALAAYRSS